MDQVRDHIPLEQGLRLTVRICRPRRDYGQRPYSIRTRIKTVFSTSAFNASRVRDHIPLEQGLRPIDPIETGIDIPVRDHIPLEQGLRHGLSSIRYT